MTVEKRRKHEFNKYRILYGSYPGYKQAPGRERAVGQALLRARELDFAGTLDIGAGRGETTAKALSLGFFSKGYEVTKALCQPPIERFDGIHNIPEPDDSWDLVTCCDVLEHILPEDTEAGLAEIARVAAKAVYIQVDWGPDYAGKRLPKPDVLHINRRELEEWVALLDPYGFPEVIKERANSAEIWLELEPE